MEDSNKVTIYDSMIVCIEVIFEGGSVPYDTYKVGSITDLKEVISNEYLEKEAIKNKANRAFVNNIYCRANTDDHINRLEFRVGDNGIYDMEANTFEGEVK